MNWLKKYKQIYEGWKNHLTNNDEVRELAEQRTKICADCSLNVRGVCSPFKKGKVVKDFKYGDEDRKKGQLVNGCSCPLEVKAKSPTSQCPLGKF